MWGWHDGGMGWGGWVVMVLVMLAFWALVVVAVVAVFRGVGATRGPVEPRAPRDAMDVLAERFARGEIDAEEYQMRAQVLRQGRPDVTHKPAPR